MSKFKHSIFHKLKKKCTTYLYYHIFISCNSCDLDIWEKEVPITKAELMSRIKNVDALFCLLTDKIDEEVLSAASPKLKIIASMSVGVDHLDLKAIKSKNIPVGYTPGVLTDATAELTMALLLATSRRLIEANRAIYKYTISLFVFCNIYIFYFLFLH